MALNCSLDQYRGKNGLCCRLCEAGKYKQKDCDRAEGTQCGECGRGFFMATRNYMDKCRECKTCNSKLHQIKRQECTAREDTVCACEAGYYCSEADCEHCRPVSDCPEGHGVKTLATRTNDTVCSPCGSGSFSNVSDYVSACRPHTRCDQIGRERRTPGTGTTDAVCGDYKTSCGWLLPAGLWAGLVLTSLTVFALVLFSRRTRRGGPRRSVSLSQAEAPEDLVPAEDATLKLPLPPEELDTLCQEEAYRPSYSCDLPAFESDAVLSRCVTQDSDDTPPEAPVSLRQSPTLNGLSSAQYRRTISEPQEDEWCGT